jgi:hypothetical protein
MHCDYIDDDNNGGCGARDDDDDDDGDETKCFHTDCITLHSNRLIKTKAVSVGVCPAFVAPYK